MKFLRSILCTVSLCLLAAGPAYAEQSQSSVIGARQVPIVAANALVVEPQPKTPIKHFIMLMQENHSFDNYFGTYPGADGIPPGTCIPVDPFDPQSVECLEPFHIGDRPVGDPDHSSATFQLQYNGGRMDGFVYALNERNQDGTIAMGYYDDRDLPYYWNLVSEYVLFDRFFTSAAGGSFENHMYWVAGVPGNQRTRDFNNLPTIFDRLQERGISWKFYVQGYDPAITYRTASTIGGSKAAQIVWAPLLQFDRFLDDPELSSHIVDLSEYYEDLQNGTLPAVAYIAPSGASEHPPGSLRSGQRFVKSLIQALMQSDAWGSSALMVSYDDWGGWYDHVPPPQVDKYGYGFRAPAFLVSPYARRGYIDSTTLDFTSALKFIEENYELEPLAERDAKANSLINAFDFTQPPRQPVFISSERLPPVAKSALNLMVPRSAYGAALVLAILLIGFIGFEPYFPHLRFASSRGKAADPGTTD